jgi:phosphoribosyl 1,2-cyclic phosphodiesterase
MKVTVWGCRGSLPTPGPEKIKYGGNTSCVQVTQGNTCIILDGGSGIQRLGQYLDPKYKVVHILLTHLHIDHTIGLGFFPPMYDPRIEVHLWGPATTNESLEDRLHRYFSPPLFPLRLSELPKEPIIHELGNEDFWIGDFLIKSNYICHPGPTLGFRISNGKSVFAFIPDHEVVLGSSNFPNDPEWTSGFEIADGADLLFHDAQFTQRDYNRRVGWGHSSFEAAISFAQLCKVKKLSFFHHDPANTDFHLDALFWKCTNGKTFEFDIELCAEGKQYDFDEEEIPTY